MQKLIVKIHRCNDVVPMVPDGLSRENYVGEGEFTDAIILEQGTRSGNASVSFFVKIDDKFVLAQLTEDLLRTLVDALNGAKAHWAENPVENIWKE